MEAPPRPGAALRAGALSCLAVVLAGCFTVDATLRPDGSGTIELGYVPAQQATVGTETARFTSPHVKVQSVTPRTPGALVKATFDDVTKLSTAEGFAMVSVRRQEKRGRERLTVVIHNPRHQPFKDEGQTWPRVALTLPGRVLAANRNAEISGNRVVWSLPLTEYVEQPSMTVWVRYRRA
jgi:hypothetical protein